MTMSEIEDDGSDLDRLRDMPIRSEEIGFAADVMITCSKCGRANAPTRAECIYCGTALIGSAAEPKLELRDLESWENGYNLVLTNHDAANRVSAASEIAALLQAEVESIRAILNSERTLPIARVETAGQASRIGDKLRALGVGSRVVSDESLSPGQPPLRLRAISFGETHLVLSLFGKPESQQLKRDDLVLIVSGVMFQGRTETIEKRKRRATEAIAETQTTSDDAVIDLYSRHDPTGWRIPVTGFDFSCLGIDKSLLAGENIERLIAKLSDHVPTARVVRDYTVVRSMLELTWPNESRKDSLGTQRTGFAQRNSSTVFSTNNLLQLTKFSRLQWHLL